MEAVMDITKERLRSNGRDVATLKNIKCLHMLGLCNRTSKRVDEAELWFRRAAEAAEEANLDPDFAQVANVRHELARCAMGSARSKSFVPPVAGEHGN